MAAASVLHDVDASGRKRLRELIVVSDASGSEDDGMARGRARHTAAVKRRRAAEPKRAAECAAAAAAATISDSEATETDEDSPAAEAMIALHAAARIRRRRARITSMRAAAAAAASDESTDTDDESPATKALSARAELKKKKKSEVMKVVKAVKPAPRRYIAYEDYGAFAGRWAACPYAAEFAHLAEHGYCVIRKVADAKAVARIQAQMWDWLELWRTTDRTKGAPLGPRRDDPATWTAKHWVPGHTHGIVQKHGVAHARFAWEVRSMPAVMAVFAALWGCEASELEPSYDAANMSYPTLHKPRTWYHTDASDRRRGVFAVQGFLALTPQSADPRHGALCVRRGGHKLHASYFAKTGERAKADWFQFKEDAGGAFAAHFASCAEVEVEAAAGDLVLWDSRLPHCGRQPYYTPEFPAASARADGRRIRGVVYLCMKARSARMTAAYRKKKRQWFLDGRMTTHSPDEGRLFGEGIRAYGAEMRAATEARIAAFKARAAAGSDQIMAPAEIRALLRSRGAESLLC